MKPQLGPYLFKQRMKRSLTLRAFCLKSGLDSLFVSRLERGLVLPTTLIVDIDRMVVGLGAGSAVRNKLIKLSAVDQVAELNVVGVESLPAFICRRDGRKPSSTKLKRLAKLILGKP